MRGTNTTLITIVSVIFLLLVSAFAPSQTKSPVALLPAPTPTPSPRAVPRNEAVSDDDVLKVTTNLVTSNALVVGRDHKFLPTLRREDFHLFENEVEQEIAYFAPVDRPFTVALVIDNSRSVTFELQNIKDAATAFVNRLRPEDRVLIIALNDDFRTIVEPTNDRQVLTQAIAGIKPAAATPLYDAVEFAIKNTLAGTEPRKAIILLTDGVDNDSRHASYQSSLNASANSGLQIYAVQFSTYEATAAKQATAPKPATGTQPAARVRRPAPAGSGFSRVDYQLADAYLHQMTELSGAALYPAAGLNDLDEAIAGIAEELHNEYTLGFYPKVAGQRGEVRRLDVRVNQPWLAVRARTSYSFGPALSTRVVNRPAPASLSEIETRPSTGTVSKPQLDGRWMCEGPFVPTDYALVKEGYDDKCPASTRKNDPTNAWFIRKPGPSETVCKGFLSWNASVVETVPIPSGYAVIGESESAVCSPSNDPQRSANAWRIMRPTGETTVCKGFLIPRGFVIANEKRQTDCPPASTENNAWIILPRKN